MAQERLKRPNPNDYSWDVAGDDAYAQDYSRWMESLHSLPPKSFTEQNEAQRQADLEEWADRLARENIAQGASQSKTHSWLETLSNTAIGFIITLVVQIIIYPLYGIHISILANLSMSGVFTVVSIIRGYFIRRFWNWVHVRARGLK